MEIIEELEPTRRSIYCGAVGYISDDGQMDTNIAIRTLLFTGQQLHCWAGGGIVADSRLDEEYQESFNKAAALLSVFNDAEVPNLVVKLGGAMMHADEMLDWLQTCNATSEPVHCVIVLGGGTFADEVRHLQRQWLFPDAAAHELAIDAMRLNAQIVSTLLPTAARFSELAPLLRPKSANPCSIWLPRGHSSALGLPP